jgi:hypothetical protein
MVSICFIREFHSADRPSGSFPYIAPQMAGHLRRFVTSPLAIFEFEFASETRAPPPLAAAAKCLALCIKVNFLTGHVGSFED